MSMAGDPLNHTGLGWVKPELDETLRQARNEVEYFLEAAGDPTHMEACAGFLHQVQGILRMVELYAPALVAQELELLAEAAGHGQVADREEACATLMRGTVLLPDYLERLQSGHRDIPVVLLPLLNDIRTARGAALLDESVLFAFAPDSASASDAELDHARGSVSGRNRELLDTVGTAVKEELLRIKDALDLYLRTLGPVAALDEQVRDLGAVADTLAMMDLGTASAGVLRQRDALAAAIGDGSAVDEQMLLAVADALLRVDAALDDQVAHLGAPASSDSVAASQESQHTVQVVAQEAISNFAHARERFDAFIETGWQHDELTDVPRLFNEVSGALRMLDLHMAADQVEAVSRFVAVELLQQRRVPTRQLDTLADAIASLEYYLEALRDQGGSREPILAIARSSLQALDYWPLPDAAAAQPATPSLPQPVQREPIVASPSVSIEPLPVVVTARLPPRVEVVPPRLPAFTFDPLPVPPSSDGDAVAVFDPVQAEHTDAATQGADDAFQAALDAAIAAFELPSTPMAAGDGVETDDPLHAAALDTPATAIADEAAGLQPTVPAGETIDESMRAIFLEELAENIEVLDSLLPAWQAEPDDLQRLRPLSRVFHSLKGSGQLVGAQALSGFSQAIEAAMAPVLSGSRSASTALVELVVQARQVLPELQAALAQGTPVQTDLEELRAVAIAVAAGEQVFFLPDMGSLQPTETPPADADGVAAQIDDVLREILEAEVDAHMRTLRAWLQRGTQAPQYADEGLLRAVHTMNGAFGMTDVPVITEVMGAAESWLKRALVAEVAAEGEVLVAMQAMADCIDATMRALQQDNPWIARQDALVAQLQALADTLPEAQWPVYALDEDELDAALVQEAGTEPRLEPGLERAAGFERALDADSEAEAEAEEWGDALPPMPAFGDPVSLQQALDEGLHVVDATAEALESVLSLDRGESIHLQQASMQADAPETAGLDAFGGDGTLDSELIDIFVAEANELLDRSAALRERLQALPRDRAALEELQRHLHTLKGSARMAGVDAIGDLCHGIEALLDAVAAGSTALDAADMAMLARSYDRLLQMVGTTRTGPLPASADDLLEALQQRLQAPPTQLASSDEQAGGRVVLAPLSPATEEPSPADAAAAQRASQVRVRADLLDRLVGNAGEVAICRSRLAQQMAVFRGAIMELERTNARLRDQLRRLDQETEAQIVARYQREQESAEQAFDPLELDRFSSLQQLSRGLNESAADLDGLQVALEEVAGQYESLLQQQAKVSGALGDGLMRARMVPLESVLPRLERVVRQAGEDAGKPVQLQVDDTHGDLDRNVLDRLVAPLEHLLRNAVAHGVEEPPRRQAAGKPDTAIVSLRLQRQGAEIVVEVADDGAGLDRAAILQRAIERGLLAAGVQPEAQALDALVFAPGLSTVQQVSQMAGRGVGLDVVRNEVRQLGGSVDVQSSTGKGTRFLIHLPQTFNVAQALFVRAGDTVHAIPVASVAGVGRIARERLRGDESYQYAGQAHELHALGRLLGQPQMSREGAEGLEEVPVLLVQAGELRAAVAVDEVLGNHEIVVKPVGPQIASIPGILGATLTAEGAVVVVLDIAPLVRNRPSADIAVNDEVAAAPQVPRVLVVDDSLTMRKVTSRILERHGLEVETARDGMEALDSMRERAPALVLLDIEMPRMDGYELAAAMRENARLREVPVVMITSRSGEKHRQRALELGVQHYLGKPYQEAELMRTVQELLGEWHGRE